ncbi:MAG TPA: DUF4410 domain-containing protein [Stellaceae bacterium]|nr:DUF4410 domain-containing protein [Stellaceae bacterium]
MNLNTAIRHVWAALAILSLAACTTTTITPDVVNKPDRAYDMIAVGVVTSDDKLWDGMVPFFRRGFRDEMKKDPAFVSVLEDDPPQPVPASMLIISGKITEVDRGSTAARFLIGFGAGREIARGTFEVRNADGVVLARFESRKAYNGGAGIGGLDMVSVEDLVQKLGEETAATVSRWYKGEPLEPPAPKKGAECSGREASASCQSGK